jgi:hypothetical protein
MSYTQTHASEILAATTAVLPIAGLQLPQHAQLSYSMGCRFLRHICAANALSNTMNQALANNQLFWTWWRTKYAEHDASIVRVCNGSSKIPPMVAPNGTITQPTYLHMKAQLITNQLLNTEFIHLLKSIL